MSVSPATLTELLDLPEQERIDLAYRLLSSLRADSEVDDLDDEDRERLHEALRRSEEDLRLGRVRPAEEVIAQLRTRHGR